MSRLPGPFLRLLAWAYNPNLSQYDRDVALANQILDESGCKRTADGTRFRLRLLTASGWMKVSEALRTDKSASR